MDGNTGHHLTEDTSRVIINKNGLEYIRAHVSERTKNRKTNPRGREVGTLLSPSVLFCRISLTHYLRGVAQFGRALALGASGRRFKSFHPDTTTMNKKYDHLAIEPKWQRYWDENKVFKVELDPQKPKYYILDMFPYPSGEGLHVGHPLGYTATDILARYKRMRGFNVLHPMGWDAFGLPAEQYAIETGTHPAKTTANNVERFKSQIKSLGFSYDWDREINTTDPVSYTHLTLPTIYSV